MDKNSTTKLVARIGADADKDNAANTQGRGLLAGGNGGIPGTAGVWWGQTPRQVQTILQRYLKPLDITPADSAHLVTEQSYEGDFLGQGTGRISALFLLEKLFSFNVSYPVDQRRPASQTWFKLIEAMEKMYGPAGRLKKPVSLHSIFLYIETYPNLQLKSRFLPLLKRLNEGDEVARYQLYDLMVKTKLWIPEGIWRLRHGVTVRVIMRRYDGGGDHSAMRVYPLWLFTKDGVLP